MPRGWLAPAALITIALGLSSAALSQTQQPLLLGILEDTPGHYADAPPYRDVRVVFRRGGDRWEAFPGSCSEEDCLKAIAAKFPAQVNWTIAFDGRALGQVTARTPPAFDFYSNIGQQQIIGNTPPPTIGKRSAEFGGFLGQAVYRPLIAVSQPNYRDPDGWKPAPLPQELLLATQQAFRQKFSKVENCTKKNSDKSVAWSYPTANIQLQKAYASNRNGFLVELSLSGNLCDGPPDDAFAVQWFVITAQREVRWLGSDMWLVDAGDYDNDGRSELVFSINGYNRGGYKLFYDDFRHTAVFEFSYH
jgi:hypothetical protein